MSRGVNKVMLLGHLGGDPEVRYTPNQQAVCNFQIATSESWKDKQTGEKQERTEWHSIVAYQRIAEICKKFLKKGSKVWIEGMLRTNKWKDKQGNDRYTTQIICNSLQMLDGKNNESEGKKQNKESYMPPASNTTSNDYQIKDDLDDNIPF